jgi:hypothetical protein
MVIGEIIEDDDDVVEEWTWQAYLDEQEWIKKTAQRNEKCIAGLTKVRDVWNICLVLSFFEPEV